MALEILGVLCCCRRGYCAQLTLTRAAIKPETTVLPFYKRWCRVQPHK